LNPHPTNIVTEQSGAPPAAAPGYRLARSSFLDPANFRKCVGILDGVTHAMSNMLMPLREYPAYIRPHLPTDSPAESLIEDMELAVNASAESARTSSSFVTVPKALPWPLICPRLRNKWRGRPRRCSTARRNVV